MTSPPAGGVLESAAGCAADDPACGDTVTLCGGSRMLIRQVRRDDAPLLADGFARLSARSRRMRFLTPKDRLSPDEVRYFTHVDHNDHEAIGAISLLDGRGAGIARYIRHADEPESAEVALTIVDAWQGCGLGGQLLTRLIDRARRNGIRRFTALMAADNAAMLRLLRRLDAETVLLARDGHTIEFEIRLPRLRCALCGRPADRLGDVLPGEPKYRRRWICRACIRAYVPAIASSLDRPWWH